MVDVYVKDIKNSLENKQYYSALSLALILPDICGSVEYPDASVAERYIGWYDKYLGVYLKDDVYEGELRRPYLSGEMVYNLRNTFLHNGQPDVIKEKIKNNDNRIQRFKLYVCNETNFPEITLSGKIDNSPFKAIFLDVRYLCIILADCALYYYNENIERFTRSSEIQICDSIDDVCLDIKKTMEDLCIENIKTETDDKNVNYSFINRKIIPIFSEGINHD